MSAWRTGAVLSAFGTIVLIVSLVVTQTEITGDMIAGLIGGFFVSWLIFAAVAAFVKKMFGF
jgi:hypothetical protein